MAITYTSRNGRTYFLSESRTSTGKPRYNFSTKPKDNPVDEIPEGYEIRESVNGIVSLARIEPCLLLPEEIAIVKDILATHPESTRYVVSVKSTVIMIHEQTGPSRQELREFLSMLGGISRSVTGEQLEASNTQHQPILRFLLINTEKRLFAAERWCFRGSIDAWIDVGTAKRLKPLAAKMIRTLGTDEFYELY